MKQKELWINQIKGLCICLVVIYHSVITFYPHLTTFHRKGAHYLLQTRTAVLNNELQDKFVCWYPGFQSDGKGPAMAA